MSVRNTKLTASFFPDSGGGVGKVMLYPGIGAIDSFFKQGCYPQ